jgi:hypothetical protein
MMCHRDWESSCSDLTEDREADEDSESYSESSSVYETDEGSVSDSGFANWPGESSRHCPDCEPEGGSVDQGNPISGREPEGGGGGELYHESGDGSVSNKEAGAWENPKSNDCDSSDSKWLGGPECFEACSYSQADWPGESSRPSPDCEPEGGSVEVVTHLTQSGSAGRSSPDPAATPKAFGLASHPGIA